MVKKENLKQSDKASLVARGAAGFSPNTWCVVCFFWFAKLSKEVSSTQKVMKLVIKTSKTLNKTVSCDRGPPLPLVVDHQLLGLPDIELQVIVVAPCDEVLYQYSLLSLLMHPTTEESSENFWRWQEPEVQDFILSCCTVSTDQYKGAFEVP